MLLSCPGEIPSVYSICSDSPLMTIQLQIYSQYRHIFCYIIPYSFRICKRSGKKYVCRHNRFFPVSEKAKSALFHRRFVCFVTQPIKPMIAATTPNSISPAMTQQMIRMVRCFIRALPYRHRPNPRTGYRTATDPDGTAPPRIRGCLRSSRYRSRRDRRRSTCCPRRGGTGTR